MPGQCPGASGKHQVPPEVGGTRFAFRRDQATSCVLGESGAAEQNNGAEASAGSQASGGPGVEAGCGEPRTGGGTDGPQWGSENHGTEGGGLGIRGLADVPRTWVHS